MRAKSERSYVDHKSEETMLWFILKHMAIEFFRLPQHENPMLAEAVLLILHRRTRLTAPTLDR